MKLTTNMIIQGCGVIAQVGTVLLAQNQLIHGTSALVIGAVVAVVQALSAYFGHVSNPDGTPAPK